MKAVLWAENSLIALSDLLADIEPSVWEKASRTGDGIHLLQ
jgi:hypothetical protein